jgi:hypothetical protein
LTFFFALLKRPGGMTLCADGRTVQARRARARRSWCRAYAWSAAPVCGVESVLCYKGAAFLVPVAGVIKLMPGTCSDPAFRRIDVDLDTGKAKGLF